MSALPYQPVPTIAQRKALHSDFERHYPIRKYSDNQAIADFQAARMRYEQPESVNFCAVPTPGEDGERQAWEWVGSVPSILIIAAACVAWVAYFWSAV
jgi:hypothetical protein